MIDDVKKDILGKMEKAVSHLRDDFSAIRSGRANPSMVDKLLVEAYGSDMPLQQLASFSVPEARQLLISPFDKGTISAIEKAIQASDLGVNPSSDGQNVRLNFPPLTEDRRKDLVKVAKSKAEDAKVSARNARRQARQDIEKLEKDGEISKDDVERVEKELDKITNDCVSEIETLLSHKEAELMEV
jgi:ribosome recycling factor